LETPGFGPQEEGAAIPPQANLNSAPVGQIRGTQNQGSSHSANPSGPIQTERAKPKKRRVVGRWTDEEHARFVEALRLFGKQWRKVE